MAICTQRICIVNWHTPTSELVGVWGHEMFGHPITKAVCSQTLEESKATAVAWSYTGQLVRAGAMSEQQRNILLGAVSLLDMVRLIGFGSGPYTSGAKAMLNYFIDQDAITIKDGFKLGSASLEALEKANLLYARDVTVLQGEGDQEKIATFEDRYVNARPELMARISEEFNKVGIPTNIRLVMPEATL